MGLKILVAEDEAIIRLDPRRCDYHKPESKCRQTRYLIRTQPMCSCLFGCFDVGNWCF